MPERLLQPLPSEKAFMQSEAPREFSTTGRTDENAFLLCLPSSVRTVALSTLVIRMLCFRLCWFYPENSQWHFGADWQRIIAP